MLKLGISASVCAAVFLFFSSLSHAKPAYSKTEKKPCTYCHIAQGKKELNDAGKYYKDHDHSLEGYVPPKQ